MKLNTGDRNTGNRNTGNRNTGNGNAGGGNVGSWNTGNKNIGNLNTGNFNAGNGNAGSWNTGNRNTGLFNTETPDIINIFDAPASRGDWDECEKPNFIYFGLTEWVNKNDMTEKEKKENEEYKATGGYLKEFSYKEAFKASYERATQEDKDKIFNLPNFDPEKFLEISGIDVRVNAEQENKKQQLIAKANELLAQAEKM